MTGGLDVDRGGKGTGSTPGNVPEVGRSLTFSRSAGGLRIVEGETLILAAPTSKALIEMAFALGTSNPLAVDKGESFDFLLTDADKAPLLDAMEPSESLVDWLYEHGIEDVVPISEPLLDSGNRIDGSAWGWYLTESGWIFAPLGEPEVLASADAWMSASMTGAVLGTGIWCWGTTILYWRTDDSDTAEYRIEYGTSDWDVFVEDVCATLLGGDTICPVCEQQDASGWEVGVDVSPVIADSVVGAALANIWRPCSDHRGQALALEAAGRKWSWSGASWAISADP